MLILNSPIVDLKLLIVDPYVELPVLMPKCWNALQTKLSKSCNQTKRNLNWTMKTELDLKLETKAKILKQT